MSKASAVPWASHRAVAHTVGLLNGTMSQRKLVLGMVLDCVMRTRRSLDPVRHRSLEVRLVWRQLRCTPMYVSNWRSMFLL